MYHNLGATSSDAPSQQQQFSHTTYNARPPNPLSGIFAIFNSTLTEAELRKVRMDKAGRGGGGSGQKEGRMAG